MAAPRLGPLAPARYLWAPPIASPPAPTLGNLGGVPLAALDDYLPLAGGTMTGALVLAGVSTAPTAAPATNTTQIASTAFVKSQNYLIGNQALTLSGDVSGTGTTAITTTLATVNANVGTFQGITVNAKGLITAAVNQSYGSVSSVGLSVPASILSVTGSPVTGSGTLALATTGTSGGIAYFSSTSALSSSALLAAGAVVVGGGAGTTPATIANGQLPATATNDAAAAGKVGEYIVSNITTPASLTSNNVANLTTISLTAGDWDVTGAISFTAAGTTPITRTYAAISTTSLDTSQNNFTTSSWSNHQLTYATGSTVTEAPAALRLSLSSTTTVYLVYYILFSVSTCTAIGILRARRVR